MAHGSNVAGEIVIGTPIGTVEEIRNAGLDPSNVASCAPGSVGGSVRGCPVWKDCRFHLRQMGGFKGHGPHNIGYYLETHEKKRKEDETSCFFFTQHLQPRMDDGAVNRMKGLGGEVIAVVAQEGEKIKKRYVINVNEGSSGDDPMYEGGRPGAPARWEPRTFVVAVARFPRPGEVNSDISYEQDLANRHRDRIKNDPSLQTGPPPRMGDDELEDVWEALPDDELVSDDEVVDDEPATAVAEPVVVKGKK